MFYCEEKTQKTAAPESRLIRVLDTTVAFATLESFGVIDAREELRPRLGRAAARTHARRSDESGRRGPRRGAHAGRPRPATAAGRSCHRAARQRIERMGSR